MKTRYLIAAAVAIVLLALVTGASHALTFPPLTGRVVDHANIIDAATRQTIND